MVVFDRDFRFRIENRIKKSFETEKIASENLRFLRENFRIFRKFQKSDESRCRLTLDVRRTCFMVIFDRGFRFCIENRMKKMFKTEKIESRKLRFFRENFRFFSKNPKFDKISVQVNTLCKTKVF